MNFIKLISKSQKSNLYTKQKEWDKRGSNPRPSDYETDALPTAPLSLVIIEIRDLLKDKISFIKIYEIWISIKLNIDNLINMKS